MTLRTSIKYLPLIGIICVFSIIVFFLIKAGNKNINDSYSYRPESETGFGLKKIHYIRNNPDEGIKWVLNSDEVRFSEDRQLLTFNEFCLKLENENGVSIEIKGEKGDYDKNSNKIRLSGNLVGNTDNGYRLTANNVIYIADEGRLQTDNQVTMSGPFFNLQGNGLLIDLNKETFEIASDALTIIDRGSLL